MRAAVDSPAAGAVRPHGQPHAAPAARTPRAPMVALALTFAACAPPDDTPRVVLATAAFVERTAGAAVVVDTMLDAETAPARPLSRATIDALAGAGLALSGPAAEGAADRVAAGATLLRFRTLERVTGRAYDVRAVAVPPADAGARRTEWRLRVECDNRLCLVADSAR
jgi:hypothetical protein